MIRYIRMEAHLLLLKTVPVAMSVVMTMVVMVTMIMPMNVIVSMVMVMVLLQLSNLCLQPRIQIVDTVGIRIRELDIMSDSVGIIAQRVESLQSFCPRFRSRLVVREDVGLALAHLSINNIVVKQFCDLFHKDLLGDVFLFEKNELALHPCFLGR